MKSNSSTSSEFYFWAALATMLFTHYKTDTLETGEILLLIALTVVLLALGIKSSKSSSKKNDR
ncbi:hypothetical protein [Thalassotalea fusca]